MAPDIATRRTGGGAAAFRATRPLLAAASIAFAAAPAPALDKVTYDDHVRPIFENKCFSCHNPDKAKGGLDLTSYNATLAGGSSGAVALSGPAANSTLYNVVTHAQEPIMPPKGDKLDDGSLARIAQWLEGGLLERADSVAKKAEKPAFSLTLSEAPTDRPEGPPPMPEDLPLEPAVVTDRAGAVSDIAASPWAPVFAVTGQKQVLFYHADDLSFLGVVPFPGEDFPTSVAFTRNGSLVVVGGGRPGKSGKAYGFDVRTGQQVLAIGDEFDSVLAADMNPAQTRLALGGPSKKVKLYDTATGELRKTITKHTEWIMAVAFSPDGTFLATGDRNGGLLVWEADTGNEVHTLEGHDGSITDLAWRPDSQALASASEDGRVRLWEMKEGKRVKEWGAHGSGTLAAAFAQEGTLVTAGRDQRAKLWNVAGDHQRDLEPMGDLAIAAAISHDGTRALVADWSGQLALFDAASGARLAVASSNPPPLSVRIEESLALVERHEADLAAAAAAFSAAEAAAGDLRRQISEAESRLAGAKSQVAAAQDELAKLTGSESALRQQRDELTRQHTELEARHADFARQHGEAEARRTGEEQRLEENRRQLDAKRRELADAPDENTRNALRQEIAALSTAGQQAAAAAEKASQESAALAAEQAIARHDATAAQAALEELGRQLAAVETDRRSMDAALAAAAAAVPKSEEEIAALGEPLAAAEKTLAEAETRRTESAANLDKARQAHDRWTAAKQREDERASSAGTAAGSAGEAATAG